MSASTCAVSGANGFVGEAVCRGFQSLGWNVVALVRRPKSAPDGCEPRPFTLGQLPPPDLLNGVDVLVHAAYDFSPRSWADICRINAVGSEYLFDAATRAGVKRQIFISSMAAFEGCRSKYGLGKLAAEHAARIRGGVVVRPGVIYSERNGGLAAQIAALAKKAPVVPMIGNGNYPLYTCHVDNLCALLLFLARAEQPPTDIITAAHRSPVTLRGLVEQGRGDKSPASIVPIPWRLVAAGLWLAEAIGVRLAVRSDSVISIVHANTAPNFTALEDIPVVFRPFAQQPR